ncbi:MAG TPA: 16S rRNA (uracil(1498)-N(3))-methyltransferase [Steroidobacteraceae bacterium]|jgi:16S rRNA (uracil1498-N3)-methyltransferase|nr:16S rRNA (uracil(1498)-N(3))-methyltransferase [Steroidobacteraceae bacterium]
MRLTRIYVPEPLVTGADVVLPAQAGEHLTRALRLPPGAPFTLFNGAGGEFSATLKESAGKRVSARVLVHTPAERESPLQITLLQGIARGERMDLIVQKATELGVTRIVPLLAERSVVKLDPRQRVRKREHWQAIAISACEQCGRNRVPEVAEPTPLGDSLGSLDEDGLRCVLAADGSESLVSAASRMPSRPIVLLIGPEGGLAESERTFAQANGFVACRLGPRIMRTETAGLAALAALQAVSGDFS